MESAARNHAGPADRGARSDPPGDASDAPPPGPAGEQAALLQAVLESAIDAILTIDERGRVLSLNPAAERLFGWSRDELVGTDVSRLMPAPFAGEHAGYLRAYLESGVRKVIGLGREVLARRRDGTTFPVHLSVSEVRLADRRLFTGFLRDLSRQRALEQEFLQAQKMEAVARFSGALAHDFNNLLMGILASARVARQELAADSAVRSLFEEIEAAAERGVALTRRLQTLHRAAPLRLRPVSVEAVVRENATMLRHLLGEDVRLHLALDADGGWALADESLIEQALINLIVNARDALPDGGEIRVATRRADDAVVLVVEDDGCGIPAEIRERIFEPFFTTKGADRGTGLGLATVRRIAEQVRGRVAVESELGRGSRFLLSFPSAAPPSAGRAPECAAPGDVVPGHTVLVVEDDRLVRASLARFLVSRGFRVLPAASPSEARALAERERFDVLLTDMVLPEIGGGELARELRARLPGLRAVFMSAHPALDLIESGRLDPGTPYLEKPFELESLQRVLEQVLRS